MSAGHLIHQVTAIIEQLHEVFDEIGIPDHERRGREGELFNALSESLQTQLQSVKTERDQMIEDARRKLDALNQMRNSLGDQASSSRMSHTHNSKEEITFPLAQCVSRIDSQYKEISKIHSERAAEVQKLIQALQSYGSYLEPSALRIKLPSISESGRVPPNFDVSSQYIAALDAELSRIHAEYEQRVDHVRTLSEDIVNLWAELGTSQAQTDSTIIQNYRESPEQIGLHERDIQRIQAKRDSLIEEKGQRERRLNDMKKCVEDLWERLSVDITDRKRFLAQNRGTGLRVLNEFQAELDRLNALKRQNLHLFVEDARCRLQELWDRLYYSEEEMLDFAPAFSDVYSDALLSAHEAEMSRLENLLEQRAPVIHLVDTFRSLIKDRDDLAAASQDASRLLMKPVKGEKRDPTRLLREEKMRKRIAKELPKVEVQLRKALEKWEDDYGRPFTVHGEIYLEQLGDSAPKALPPRAKTPSSATVSVTSTKQVPLKSAPQPRCNTTKATAGSASASRSASRPKSRAGAVTPAPASQKRNAPKSAPSNAAGRTPSKIPSRAPLSTSRYGPNSPERPQASATSLARSTLGNKGLSSSIRMPPPPMKDLTRTPHTMRDTNDENAGCLSVASSVGSGYVKAIQPEDVYDDRERMSYVDGSLMRSSYQSSNQHLYQAPSQNGSATNDFSHNSVYSSRQLSATSHSSSNGAVGSENWETFDSASEADADARDGYRSDGKFVGLSLNKRAMPEGGYMQAEDSTGKKFCGVPLMADRERSQRAMLGMPTQRMLTPSDSAWTDDSLRSHG